MEGMLEIYMDVRLDIRRTLQTQSPVRVECCMGPLSLSGHGKRYDPMLEDLGMQAGFWEYQL